MTNMAIPTERAYEILNLPLGASKDAIEQSYKKLAVKWHPEKYAVTKRTQEALKKFKLINLAYRKLIHNNEKDITLHEMFEQYRQVFHSDSAKKNKNTLLELTANNNYLNTTRQTTTTTKTDDEGVENNNNNNYENRFNVLRCDDPIDQGVQAAIKSKVKALATKANEFAKQGDFVKAIEKFTEALRYDLTDHRIFSNRSYCYDKINCFQEALIDAERAIALEPYWPKGYFRKGRALFGLKMYKEAEEAYEKVLEIENINDSELDQELFKTRAIQLQEMGFSKSQSELAVKENVTVQAALEAIFMCSEEDRSNESCSDMDNNELDYNENDSENGEDHLSSLLKNKLNSIKSKSKQTGSTSSGSGSSSPVDKGPATSSTTTTTTTTASYLATLLSNPAPMQTSLSTNHNQQQQQQQPTSPNTTPATTSLWVGNVDPSVSESTLYQLFSAYGHVINVRCLPDKYCAFVNFKTKEDSGKALAGLQGKPLEGQRLLLKYPDNPITAAVTTTILKNKLVIDKKSEPNSKVVKKTATTTTSSSSSSSSSSTSSPSAKQQQQQQQQQQQDELDRNSGPVNGNECYFWRTTGCIYADKCRYEHIKKHKGIDKKPWHKP